MTEIRNLVIGVLVFVVITTGVGLYAGSMTLYYGADTGDVLANFTSEKDILYNKTRESLGSASSNTSSPLSTGEVDTDDSFINAIYTTAYQGASNLYNSFETAWRLLFLGSRSMGIPVEMVWAIGAIILAIVTFALISAVFKWRI